MKITVPAEETAVKQCRKEVVARRRRPQVYKEFVHLRMPFFVEEEQLKKELNGGAENKLHQFCKKYVR
ncbi:hypothetical protein [Enterococcus sp. BWB1-3]|uniref:hypothetical protein n=1 Tax=Enterococcus sp. BWB1-3 TaxID=2787713 RepID=UPI003FA54B90